MKHARPDYDTIQDLSIARALARVCLMKSDIPSFKKVVEELAAYVLGVSPPIDTLSILTQTLLEEEAPKIPDDEPVFLIRAQDKAAVATLDAWIHEANKAGATMDILRLVAEHRDRMAAWPTRKIPDLPKTSPFSL